MTPTEQDKEIDLFSDEVLKIAEALRSKYPNTWRLLYDNHGMPDVIKFIAADRERMDLEARIAEINYLDDNFQTDSQDWEREHPGYSTAMIPMEDYIRRRTELKLEQSFEKR